MVLNVLNVVVGGTPGEGGAVATASSAMEFELTLELTRQPESEGGMFVEWKMVYVFGENSRDQVLEVVEVGPLEVATMKFVFSAPPPNLYLVPKEDQLDVGAVYISGVYQTQEFIRIGYYVKHEYQSGYLPVDPVTGQEIFPDMLELEKLIRRVDAANPRVTRFVINWHGEGAANPLLPPPVTYGDMEMEDEVEEDEDEEDDDDEDEEEDGDISIDISDEEGPENGGGNKQELSKQMATSANGTSVV